MRPFALRLAMVMTVVSPVMTRAQGPSEPILRLHEKDRMVILGNATAERMQYFGNFETLLQSRFPSLQITVRNLGWAGEELRFGWAQGDESALFRSKDFADHGHRLKDHRPSVLLACFGFNESFGGRDQLEAFRQSLRGALTYWIETPFDGVRPLRVVLVTPLPHEDLHQPSLPDGKEANERIAAYVEAMQQVAAEFNVPCADVFHPLLRHMEDPATDLTINGVHMNAAGDRALAEVLDAALFGPRPRSVSPDMTALRDAIIEKDTQFNFDYRAVNGYYIYGGRKAPFGIVNFPAEFAKLRQMIERRDERIWKIAAGETVPETIDDSGTGDLTPIETNVPRETRCLTPEEELATFHVPRGYVVELFASEREFPELAKPCQIAIDARGRVWACTMPTYPQYLPGVPPHDQIIILDDMNRDGKADQCKVFAEGLHLPTGFEIGDRGAYVAQQANLVHFRDDDGDDRADRREIVLSGFDTADSHHSISAFTWGPGGELYFQEGTFHHSQVESPYGVSRVKDAAVYRYEPKSRKFDVFVSYPFANPWGHCFDPWGQNFIADASTGNNYFAAAFSGQVIFPQKHRTMQTFLVKQWRPTAGCTLVTGANFPTETQGDFLLTNCIGFQGVLQYRMREDGSGVHAEPVEPLLSSTDPACRPVDVKFGLDGCVYVCDWYNPLVGHMQHNLRDPKRDQSHGRIWRIRYADGAIETPPKIAGATTSELVQLLTSANDQHRYAVRRELRTHPTAEVLRALEAWLASPSNNNGQETASFVESPAHRQLEALWVAQHHDVIRDDWLQNTLQSDDARLRAAGVRVLCYWRDRIPNAMGSLIRAAGDPHSRVRLEAVRAASFLSAEEGDRVLQTALQHPLDYYLQYTLKESSDTLELRGGRSGGAANAAVARLASGQVQEEQVLPLVQLSTEDASASTFRQLFLAVMEAPYASSTKLSVVDLLLRESEVRKLEPTIPQDQLMRHVHVALAHEENSLAARLLQLAEAWRLPSMVSELTRLVRNPETPSEVRLAALSVAAADTSPAGSIFVRELVTTDDHVERYFFPVATVLAQRDLKRAASLVIQGVREKEIDYESLRIAIQAVLRQQTGASELAQAVRGGDIQRDPARMLLRAVFAAGNSDQDLTEVLAEAAGARAKQKPLSAEEKAGWGRRIETNGNAQRGEEIFRRAELNCVKCHALSGAGGNIGPDLSAVGSNSPIEYLIDSLLFPSLQVKEAFITRKVLTTSGQVVTGIRVDGDPQRIVLRTAEGREVTIATDDIEEELEGASLMPEGLHQLLTESEFADLVRFLAALGKPGAYAVNREPTIQRLQLLVDEPTRQVLKSTEASRVDSLLDGLPVGAWETRYARVDGRFMESDWRTKSSKPMVMKGAVRVTVPGPLRVRVEPPVAGRAVIAGKTYPLDASEDWQAAAGEHAVHLVFDQGIAVPEIRVRVEKPENAATQYTIVGGL